jgi:uncharacterized membrane protein
VSELVAFVFRDQFRAPEVLNELRRRDYAWVKDLDEAVAVTLNAAGKARVQLSIDISTYEGAGWAKLWGSLLNSTLFLPATAVLAEAADGLAASNGKAHELSQPMNGRSPESGWWREALARSVNFQRDVAALMEPSGSAIFMLLRNADTPVVLKQLRNYGDTIVHTSLSSEQDKKMLALLALSKENRS